MHSIQITEVTLKMLVDSGLLKPNTILYADSNPNFTAKINKDGFIELPIENKMKKFPFPSGAARAVVKLSVNGWKFWKVKVQNDLIELSEFREMYKTKFN